MKPSRIHELRELELRQRIRELTAEAAQWKRETAAANAALGVALRCKKHQRPAKPIYGKSRNTSETTAFLIGSDWHAEETVLPGTVNGLNEFNLDIADRRIDRFFNAGLNLINIQRAATDIHTCVVGLLGDHITGYIHEELVEANALSPTETVLWLQPRIRRGLDLLRPHFQQILVVCCCGNHGRTTPKMRVSTSYKNSYEWLMYHTLAAHYEGTNVQFQIGQSYHSYLNVYGRRIRFHHGDGMNYQGGVGGLYIPVNKAIARWNQSMPAYLDVFGHWHQEIDGGRFISNGSLIGYNAYALRIGASPEQPQQTCFFIERTRGKTIVCPVFL